jgi:hypothetical protein
MKPTPRRNRLAAALLTVVLAVVLAATSASVNAAGGAFVAQVKATLGIGSAAATANVEEFDTRAGAVPFAPALRPVSDDGLGVRAAAAPDGAPSSVESVPDRYIVVFREAALASYDGSVPGYAKPEKLAGKARLNVKGARAQAYVGYLKSRQADHEAKIGRTLGRSVDVSIRMQHAVNAIAMTMSPAEAAQVAALPEVLFVEPVRDVPLDTDVGPVFIGAGPLWDGTNPGSTGPVRGEGTVIGVIDSGINFGSPSFAAVDPVDAYAHVNPLGAGTYLGTCLPGGVDEGRCNAKLIGGYDFVCGAPGNQCGLANVREEPGFGDTNGHGSHTASTVAGNNRDVVVGGVTRRISGVAPRANVIAYDVCYTNTATGQGLCPTVSSAAAVNQAIADGVVDAINFSIGGGASPWTETVSLAFLSATQAGIYVAASAGNSGPGPNTMGHLEPWTASTAASQHGRSSILFYLNGTGPGTVPPAVAAVPVNPGTGGVAFAATIPGSTPFRVSAGIDTANDACAAFPAGTFAGAIALVRRGTCSFTIKADNAAAAGAIAVVIANNAAPGLIPSVPGTTVPVFGTNQADGDNLRNWGQANPATATAGIPFPATVTTNTPDQLAAFSSRGPAGTFDLLKPDLTAPGVSVLAAVAGTTITGFESAVDFYGGTSMASPHNAGSSLLLRQLKPSWSVPEIKSALEMTAKRTVLKEDGVTPATPFDMGGGRVRVDRAANAGLLLDETSASFTAANPGTGGDPTTLNIPSYAKRSCVGGCQFVRTFRSPLAASRTWNASVTGLTGTVTPSTFTVPAGGMVALTTTIDPSSIVPDGAFNFGWLELVPSGGTPDDALTLPLAVAVPPPVVTLVPPSQNVSLYEGLLGSASFDVQNNGGFPLTWAVDQTGQGLTTVYAADSTGVGSGFRNTIYTDPATAGSQAQFAADDFTLATQTTITSIFAEGFTVSGGAIATVATNLTWSIYPDAGGFPAGNPQTASGAAVWTYTATPTATGVTTSGSNGISLDLVAAGQSVPLAPGRYWLVVNTRSTFANRWAQYGSNTVAGGGFASITIATAGTGSWTANNSFPGLTFRVTGTVPCGASWIGGSTPASGIVAGGAAQGITTQLSAVGVAAGSYLGTVCLATNDTLRPKVAEILNLTVTAPPAGTASQLVFTTPPAATGSAGVAWAPQPVVTVQDVGGATVTGYTTPVTLSLASGTGPLVCDANPVVPVNGVATFSGCRVDTLGVVTLRATSGIIPDSTTNPAVTIGAGPPTQLVFSTPPSGSATANVPWPQQPVLTLYDALGNVATSATTPVLLALSPPGGALTCAQNPVTPVDGVATFTGCRVGIPGSYTLNASSGSIASATTNPAIVVAEAQAAVIPSLGTLGLAALGLFLGLAGVLVLRRAV